MKITTLMTRIICALSEMEFANSEFTTAPKSNYNYSDYPRITGNKLGDLSAIGVTINHGKYRYLWEIDFTEMVHLFYEKHRQLFLYTVAKHGWRRQYRVCEGMYAHIPCFQWPEFTPEDKEMMKKYGERIAKNAKRTRRPMKKKTATAPVVVAAL